MSKADLRREVASASRDIFVPVFGNLMRPTDDVLLAQGGGKGLGIYEELERDPHTYAVLMKRKLALVARDWEVEPGGSKREDRKAAELAERVLGGEWGLSFDKVCVDLQDAVLKGYAVAEVIWAEIDGHWIPVEVKPKNQRRFVFDPDGRVRMLTLANMIEGEELPERKILVHRFGDKTGDPYGRGLGHQLFWWIYFKRMAAQFWLVFAEKFGSPTVVGEYEDTMPPEEQDRLLDHLTRLSNENALIVKAGTAVKFLEAVRSGSVTYPDLVEYCDQQITLAVLGNTLTTTVGDSGSRALGDVHAGVEETIVDADADMLSATLNSQLLAWITWLNYPSARPPRVWRPRPTAEAEAAKTEQEQIKALQAALGFVEAMRRAGWEPEDPSADLTELWRGKWTFTGKPAEPEPEPEPQEGKEPPQLAAPGPAGFAGNPTSGGPAPARPKPRDTADDLADQLDLAAAGAMEAMIDRVREVIAGAGSLDDVAHRLLAEYGTVDAGELAEVLGQAMQAAALSGAAEEGP